MVKSIAVAFCEGYGRLFVFYCTHEANSIVRLKQTVSALYK